MALSFTTLDDQAVDLIRRCGGFVMIVNGEPELPGKNQISKRRFSRLIALGRLTASDDALFAGIPPQTYRLKEENHVSDEWKT